VIKREDQLLRRDSNRTSLPDAPAARSWGNVPGASFVRAGRVVALAALTALAIACTGPAAPRASSPAAPTAPATHVPSGTVAPSPTTTVGATPTAAVTAAPTPSTAPATTPPVATPVATPGGTASIVQPPIESIPEAILAVGAADSRFLGYTALDPEMVGQSAWVEPGPVTDAGFELLFVGGSGDCMAGCIDKAYAKFLVGRDGTVTLRCEWERGEVDRGTPC
jgi:hypothetical protein